MINFFKRLARRLDPEPAIVPEWVDEYVDPRSPEERAYVEQFAPEDELSRIRRQRDEYFSIIERIEKERDGLWKMYRESVSEHLNAQALLERHLMNTRQQLGRVVVALNRRRKAADLEPIKKPNDLEPYEGEPVGTAKQFAESVIALCARFPEMLDGARPKMVDGAEEREKIGA